jgi:flagellar motor switch protein FliN/FliY
MTDENELNTPGSAETPDSDAAIPEAGEAPQASEDQSAAAAESGESESAVAVAEEEPVSEEASADEPEQPLDPEEAAEKDAEAKMMAMLNELPEVENETSPEDIKFDSASVANAEFQQLTEPAGNRTGQNIDLLLDINLPVSIELGRTRLSISEILSLGPGSVVELSKLAGEPVDLLVNYKVVARGEVVVVDENFGVRITQLMTPEERLKILGEEQ